jgi:hypothetical protein
MEVMHGKDTSIVAENCSTYLVGICGEEKPDIGFGVPERQFSPGMEGGYFENVSRVEHHTNMNEISNNASHEKCVDSFV